MVQELSSKERVLTAFAREEPDRVPINYLYNPGIHSRLKHHFGLASDDDEGLRRVLGVDFREVAAPYTGPKLHADVPGRDVDIWGVHRLWIEYGVSGYWDYCDFPLKEATLEEIERWPMPLPDHYDYSQVAEQCRRYQDYCVVVGSPGLADCINSTGFLRTMEQVLIDLISDEPACLRYFDRKCDVQLETVRRMLEAAEGGIDVLWMGEDLGTQQAPMISRSIYLKHLRPRHQGFVDLAQEYGIPVMFHSCGSSSWVFDDFIDQGIGVVDTLQPEVTKMAPAYLKERYGDRLAFHGCISTAGPVSYGTVEETVDNVRTTLETMMPGGGYALSPTHQLQDNSPTENVVALYEAAHKYGRYR